MAYIKPHKLEEVRSALAILPITGLSVSDVRGCGTNNEAPTTFLGLQSVIRMPIRSKIELVVHDEIADEVIETLLESAHTGQAGDGKIFVEPVLDCIRIRTGDRGPDSL